jgi:hypothetical protein
VRHLLAAWLFFTALLAGALLFARLLEPGWFELELDVFILVVGGLAVANVVIVAREAFPLDEGSALVEALNREPPGPQRPAELGRLERELTMATGSAFDTHARLRPVVREIAGSRLAARGLRLQDSEELLGSELWELAREDREEPSDRHAAGIPADELRRAVDRLETL